MIYKFRMSNDKYQQSMQNWKKEIIIDATLNGLFDGQLTAQDYLQQKIMTLPHQEVIKVYMKLTSLKHVITKNMQKEIELRHAVIEHTFQECLRSKSSYEDINQQALRDSLKQIQRFNEKYELISQRVNEIKNINKILHFSKALEKFKVNARLLKSMMQDYDQNSTSKIQSQLLNTLKISKIIKEISLITIKFDFSGIKSFEEERHFLNNTKGTIFGLVQRQLTSIFNKIPNEPPHRRAELEKDIVNKFIILNNLMKLKDFCIPFYKNTLKQMSELLKKSLVIGQSVDQRDPRTHLQTFQEYFTVSLRKRLVENGTIFISFDELLKKSNFKTPFNFNFFEKYWQNVTSFMKDLITWSIENDSKDWNKEKNPDNAFQAFKVLDNKNTIPKYLMAILWKYPIIYEALTSISNQIHLHIIKNVQFHNYQFLNMKQQFLRVLLPLAQIYYKHAGQFYETWVKKVERLRSLKDSQQPTDNAILKRAAQVFEDSKNSKDAVTIDSGLRVVQWMIFNLKTSQIFDFHSDNLMKIVDLYCKIFADTCTGYEGQTKDDFLYFVNKAEQFISKTKIVLRRGSVSQKGQLQRQFSKISYREGILGISSNKLITLIKAFKSYENWLQQIKNRAQ